MSKTLLNIKHVKCIMSLIMYPYKLYNIYIGDIILYIEVTASLNSLYQYSVFIVMCSIRIHCIIENLSRPD